MQIDRFMNGFMARNPSQSEFHQAVREFAEVILPYMKTDRRYKNISILERMTEPDRIIIFRVCWEDDKGRVNVDRGYRVQFNNSIGPYKGGLRFDRTVNLSILKFLGFEQCFKNALTGLPMGGAKGGSNFNPKGRSDREVMRFCQSYMTELYRHIGKDTDIPAGDMGCGAREISFL
ncbi:NADP-specific glutamate dehydrogenase, partial [hydrothermal vent metagenome]